MLFLQNKAQCQHIERYIICTVYTLLCMGRSKVPQGSTVTKIKKKFKLKNEGYRNGIKKRQDRNGIARLKLLTVESFTRYKSMT